MRLTLSPEKYLRHGADMLILLGIALVILRGSIGLGYTLPIHNISPIDIVLATGVLVRLSLSIASWWSLPSFIRTRSH